MLNLSIYKAYIQELREHLFRDGSMEQIVEGISNSHRKRRFLAMYVMQSKEIFDLYYKQRLELGLDDLFNQIISALFSEKSELKNEFISILEITPDMVSKRASPFEIKEMEKDLNAYLLYQQKRRR
ncbi:hypothetical protein [Aneurinibacillus terranovensis]|uniref:hypothetical protein n=1 Tax=Aneurinibacillus terranovensis TaxID=278991 RepID=UPI0003F7CB1D|nr:hypothetical protein [Aneurinibacillus terranovensis]